jgi:hypothetical protein
MVKYKEEVDFSSLVATAKFWLMLKIFRNDEKCDKFYEFHIGEIKKYLEEVISSDDEKEKKLCSDKMIARVMRRAWETIPSEFLRGVNIPRNIRR